MIHKLIGIALRKIGVDYQPGALDWLKQNRPKDWEKMVAIEKEINRLASADDEEGMVEALDKYERFVLRVVDVFSNHPILEMWTEEDGKKVVLFSERVLPCPSATNSLQAEECRTGSGSDERNRASSREKSEQKNFVWFQDLVARK